MKFINYEDVKKLTRQDLIKEIKAKANKISEIKLGDFLFTDDGSFAPTHGVYLFLNENKEVLYVGKNSARSYIERIPAHFDVRFAAWMNSFFMDYIKAKNINITPNLIRNMYNSSEVQNQIKKM
ncbi:hypothetical protein [Treponema phagedenis]|uniref:GIY-YIG domain-containing protein n=1 Tax=Treponema phagedenis TaxID=162 RepID=A0A0B7H295_TREPH|nr:hypothetical protein [Treponema phagedenis]NVP24087.1 hypothetical protein [Treponema phagedenis]QEJ96230.1 hypothetical protein FUT79_14175 [Treponema phagedenis]QEJ99346.1 hypothetical protein FUT82_16020 [Treponema phagedenis]QEK00008.1 hypothetical protein FUT84_01645 [Treponema phagedenis]QEK04917.1 hypothetical protein FUT83_14670 [Treponema phagedenis]